MRLDKKKMAGVIIAFVLLVLAPANVSLAAKTNSFEKKKGYTYYLDENGKKVKDKIVDVDGASYYLDKKGIMIKGWVKSGKRYYYFDRKSGKMKTDCKVDGIQLKKDGSAKTDKYSKEKIKTMITARKVVAKITKPTDSKSSKIKACCKYVMDPPYVRYRFLKPIMNKKGWECTFANDIFKKGKGDCVSETCALAFLFKELNMKNIYVCHDTSHSWVEVDGKVYDPLFAEAKKDHGYLNVTYKEFDYNGITEAPYKRKIR